MHTALLYKISPTGFVFKMTDYLSSQTLNLNRLFCFWLITSLHAIRIRLLLVRLSRPCSRRLLDTH